MHDHILKAKAIMKMSIVYIVYYLSNISLLYHNKMVVWPLVSASLFNPNFKNIRRTLMQVSITTVVKKKTHRQDQLLMMKTGR